MIPDLDGFRGNYVAEGGSPRAAASYLTYLRRVDRNCGGIDAWLQRSTIEELVAWMDRQPHEPFGTAKDWRDSRSAIRKYARYLSVDPVPTPKPNAQEPARLSPDGQTEVLDLLRAAKDVGARYYRATGKPLGVTGEVAELEAAERLGLTLAPARTRGYDAIRTDTGGDVRVQIKGRAVDPGARYRGRCPSIKCGGLFDIVLLVLLDRSTLDALEIWEASEEEVIQRLSAPGSKARNDRNSLGISQFKSIARCVWRDV